MILLKLISKHKYLFKLIYTKKSEFSFLSLKFNLCFKIIVAYFLDKTSLQVKKFECSILLL